MSRSHAEIAKLNHGRIAAAFQQEGAIVDTVAEKLELPREAVNIAAPWARAELDHGNSDVYELELSGPDCEWDFRDHEDFYDGDGKPRDGAQADKLVKPYYARVTLRARSDDEAKQAALDTHPAATDVTTCKKV